MQLLRKGVIRMPLACGCDVLAGASVSLETLKKHFKHTFEVLVFWELIVRPQKPLNKNKLIEARLAIMEAIEELFPEAGIRTSLTV